MTRTRRSPSTRSDQCNPDGDASGSSRATPDGMATLQAERRATPRRPFADARLSPDGRLVAFVDERGEGVRGIYVAERDGTHARRISGPERASAPSWSPDSSLLAFVKAEPQQPGVWNVWAYRVATGELRRLSSSQHGVARSAAWFPNGERLAFSHGATLVIVDIETVSSRRFESPVAGSNAARLVGLARWPLRGHAPRTGRCVAARGAHADACSASSRTRRSPTM